MDLDAAEFFLLICAWTGLIVGTVITVLTYQERRRSGQDRRVAVLRALFIGAVLGSSWGWFPFVGLWRLYLRWEDRRYQRGHGDQHDQADYYHG